VTAAHDEPLDRAVAYALGSLNVVTLDRLTSTTPCRGWDLTALLRHLDDSLAALHEGLTFGRVAALPTPADVGGDLVACVRARAVQLIGQSESSSTVTIAERELPRGVLAVVGALELTVHGWDIARACGLDRPIPPRLAAELLAVAPMVVTEATRPEQFGVPVMLSRAASNADRLIAFLGRDPSSDLS
jgi:uncharacterized protein (TIGR03086 family)